MAANVETLFVTRTPAWHKQGIILPESPTSEDAIVAAGLDWEVTKEPVFDSKGVQIPNYFANTRNTDSSVLGVVSGRYEIVQNKEAFAFTDSLVGEGLTYESAGALSGGKKVWLLGNLPSTSILGDKVIPYICFANTFDGSGAIQVCCVHTRVVCENTLNLALSTAKRKWSTRHVGDMQSKLQEAQITLGLINKYTEELNIEAERLAAASITDAEVEAMLDNIYPIKPEDGEIRKRRVDQLKEGFFNCLQAADIKQFRNTKYAVVMAATDYADHSEPMRKTANFEANRWYSVMQGHPFVDTIYKQLAA